MEPTRLANTFDYEVYAKEFLDRPTFEHLQGLSIRRPAENIADYDLIKLKALGLMSLATFQGVQTAILGGRQAVKSPLCVGPFPALHDIKLTLNGSKVTAGAAVKSVCDELGLMSVVPMEQVREVVRETTTKNPFMLYVVPDQAVFQRQTVLIKHVVKQLGSQVAGIVLESGYLPSFTQVDKRNRYKVPDRVLEGSPKPPTKCNFRFSMIQTLKQLLGADMPVVVRGIASLDDALRAAESGASAVWISEKNHFGSATSPISLVHNTSQTLASLHPDCEVFVQGGVRRGTDVLKGVALGAQAVFVDNDTLLWGLVRDGNPQGLRDTLQMLNDELRLAMVLTHSEDINSVTAARTVEWVQPKAHQWRYKL